MIGLEPLRWVLTVTFAATCGFHLVRCARPAVLREPIGEHRISEALHLTVGVSMVAMIWPWGEKVPVTVWAAVFALSIVWFTARTILSTGRRLVMGFFATTTTSMVWMGVCMPAHAAAGRGQAMHDMPGVSMTTGKPNATGWISCLVGGYLVLAAFWWFSRGLRLGNLATASVQRPLSWPAICHGLMSIGMGLAVLAMA